MNQSTQSHSDKLAAAAEITAKARHEIETHEALAATVHRFKAAAVAGELDDAGAADLVRQSEALRLAEITLPRRKRAFADAEAAEIKVGLEILTELAAALDPVEADAAQAADKLTEALVCPLAAALEEDTVLAREIGVGRCSVERGMPGVYRAAVLQERLKNASTTTWGAAHVPTEAREIVQVFDSELAAIRSGTAMLRATLKAALKARE